MTIPYYIFILSLVLIIVLAIAALYYRNKYGFIKSRNNFQIKTTERLRLQNEALLQDFEEGYRAFETARTILSGKIVLAIQSSPTRLLFKSAYEVKADGEAVGTVKINEAGKPIKRRSLKGKLVVGLVDYEQHISFEDLQKICKQDLEPKQWLDAVQKNLVHVPTKKYRSRKYN